MNELTQLSDSRISRFSSCPLSFYHKYLNEQKPEQKNVVSYYADYGTLIHFFAEFYPRINFHKSLSYDKREPKPINDLTNNLIVYGNYLVEHAPAMTLTDMLDLYAELFQYIDFPDNKTSQQYYTQGVEFLREIAQMDWSNVIGLEQQFSFKLSNKVPEIIGFIDKLERDEKGIIVTDYKTSKPYSIGKIKSLSQLKIYGMACYIMYGELPYKYKYHFTRFNKVIEVEINKDELNRTIEMINYKYRNMLFYMNEKEFPPTPQYFYCDNFCGYKHICPIFKTT